MKEQLNTLIKQREQLHNELINANRSEWRDESSILKALESNSKLIELLLSKSHEQI
jgi:hypothetical protein